MVEVARSSLVAQTSVSVHKATHIFYICYEHFDQISTAIMIRNCIVKAVLIFCSKALICKAYLSFLSKTSVRIKINIFLSADFLGT